MGSAAGSQARSTLPPAVAGRFFEFSLLGLMASGYLAVAASGFLDPPTVLLTGAALFLRVLISAGWIRLNIPERYITAATLVYAGFYPLDYLLLSREFLGATVHLVFFLAIVKILTARTARDYFYVKLIAFLQMLAASVLSAGLSFFIFLAFFLLFGTANFAAGEVRRSAAGKREVRVGKGFSLRLALLSTALTVGVLALAASMFFVLPRTARAAFQHLVPERYHLPGFSAEVALGKFGQIKQQSVPVMHVRFLNGAQPAGLKWRGAALADFDGKRWFNSSNTGQVLRVDRSLLSLSLPGERWRNTPRVGYEVTLRPLGTDTLFFAGTPELLQIDAPFVIRTRTDGLRAAGTSPGDVRYTAYAALPHAGGSGATAILGPAAREIYTRLPSVDTRIAALAARLGRNGTDEERARNIERSLRQNYSYTTELLDGEVPDPLAHFLFDRRKGHCEYFASAMAVMLRSTGIPARVVTGFQSGIFNPLSGLQLVRSSDAHSWVEAYIEGRGWLTYDPTPPDPSSGNLSLWTRAALYLDAAETFWQQWVLNYDIERQLSLATGVERSRRNFRLAAWKDVRESALLWIAAARNWSYTHLPRILTFTLFLGALALVAKRAWRYWLHRRRHHRLRRGEFTPSDAGLLYQRMLDSLKRQGFEKPRWMTPLEFAALLPAQDLRPLARQITDAYNRLRYAGAASEAITLVSLLERLDAQSSGSSPRAS